MLFPIFYCPCTIFAIWMHRIDIFYIVDTYSVQAIKFAFRSTHIFNFFFNCRRLWVTVLNGKVWNNAAVYKHILKRTLQNGCLQTVEMDKRVSFIRYTSKYLIRNLYKSRMHRRHIKCISWNVIRIGTRKMHYRIDNIIILTSTMYGSIKFYLFSANIGVEILASLLSMLSPAIFSNIANVIHLHLPVHRAYVIHPIFAS